jgi:uncharacterized protein (DUF488 family)
VLTRQKILLRLLADNGSGCSKLQITKLAFLLAQEGRSEQLKTFYEFVPYKFGPYSFGLAHELENLHKEGYVTFAENDHVELASKGKKWSKQALDTRLARDIELLSQNYGNLDQKKLIDTVYTKHPWFTANSQFPNKRKAKITAAEPGNYTIGYQSFQVDGLLNKLLEVGIKRLLDTRSNPISRRYGFHKSTLSRLCSCVGIAYEHLPELGVPSSWRQELELDEEYNVLFKRYEREILDKVKPTIETTAWGMNETPSALLCREAFSGHCHRSVLAKRLKALNGLPIIDLASDTCHEDQPLLKFNSILMK